MGPHMQLYCRWSLEDARACRIEGTQSNTNDDDECETRTPASFSPIID